MKVRKLGNETKATKQFTDRTEFRKAFWDTYKKFRDAPKEEREICVLTYYGMGGIGKSTLLKKLTSELEDEIKNEKHILYDFETAQDMRLVLESIRNLLATKYGFTFPLFDVAVYSYAVKTGGDVSGAEIKAMTERSPLLSFVSSMVGMLPVVGTVAQLMVCVDKGATFVKGLVEKHKRSLYEIESETPAEIYNHLPELFALDLADNVENLEEPLVIFFDTYEKLVNELSSVGDSLSKDLWLRGDRGLIQNIPNTIWIIAGREKLKWENFDSGWASSLQQHILGSLSEMDGISFLKSARIADEKLCKQLYKLAQGTPVYLDMCVDRYYALIDEGKAPVIEDFGHDEQSLVERFVRYMDAEHKEMMYLLACLRIWTDELAFKVGQSVIPSFKNIVYESVKDFSFISISNDDILTMHQMICSVMKENCPKNIRRNILEASIFVCNDFIKDKNLPIAKYEFYLRRMLSYCTEVYDGNDFRRFYDSQVRENAIKRCRNGQSDAILGALDMILDFWNGIDGKTHAYFTNERAICLSYAGRYGEALLCAKACVDEMEASDGTEEDMLRMRSTLGEMLRKNGDYQQALEEKQKALDRASKVYGSNSVQYYELSNDICAILDRLHRYQESLDLGKKIYEAYKGFYGENDLRTLNVMFGMAQSLRFLKRHSECFNMTKEIYEKRKIILGDNDLETIESAIELGYCYKNLGKMDEAYKLLRCTYEKCLDVIGEDHPFTLLTLNGIWSVLHTEGRLDECLDIEKKVYEKRRDRLGEKHPTTVGTLQNLGLTYYKKKLYEQACVIFSRTYEYYKDVFGEDYTQTENSAIYHESCLMNLGKYDEACSLRRGRYENKKKRLGLDSLETRKALNSYLWACHMAGRWNEVMELVKEQKAFYDKATVENLELKTYVLHMDTVAYLYYDAENYDIALPIAEHLLELVNNPAERDENFIAKRKFLCSIIYFKKAMFTKTIDLIKTMKVETMEDIAKECGVTDILDDIKAFTGTVSDS